MFLKTFKFALILIALVAPPLISATFQIGNGTIIHRLFKRFTSMVDAPNMNYQACVTPTGSAGHCTQMQHCSLEFKINYLRVFDYLCVMEQSAVGICCPNDLITDTGRPSLPSRGDDMDLTPAESRKMVNRPEDRGCGLSTKQFPKVTVGRPAEPKEWPWMAVIFRPESRDAHCGGVLVTDRHVLTAAHCFDDVPLPQNLFVRLGEYNFSSFDETRARDFRISEIRAHADYDPLSYDYDIAVLKLAQPTIFTSYIWPVCMPPVGEKWEGSTGVIAGWGTQFYQGPHSDVLMEVSVPIWKNDDCQEKMINDILDSMLCAGAEEGGRDSCQGDSGGPLLVQLPNKRWVVVGLVSWGFRCGEANLPGIYTRVNSFTQWIIDNSQF